MYSIGQHSFVVKKKKNVRLVLLEFHCYMERVNKMNIKKNDNSTFLTSNFHTATAIKVYSKTLWYVWRRLLCVCFGLHTSFGLRKASFFWFCTERSSMNELEWRCHWLHGARYARTSSIHTHTNALKPIRHYWYDAKIRHCHGSWLSTIKINNKKKEKNSKKQHRKRSEKKIIIVSLE